MLKVAKFFLVLPMFLVALLHSIYAQATIVRFETTLGNIDVNLYDQDTTLTVANFLSYVESDAYDGTLIHRSDPGFVIQGGGFSYGGLNANNLPFVEAITTLPPVSNEPVFSNVRGTIAMAKLGGYPDSATSQWFFNLADNSTVLDQSNSGFSVFGEIVAGLDVLAQIEGLVPRDMRVGFSNSAMGELPLQDYTDTDEANSVIPDQSNLIEIMDISIIDAAVDSASGLNPPRNHSNDSSGGGGGPIAPFLLNLLVLLCVFSRWRKTTRSFL